MEMRFYALVSSVPNPPRTFHYRGAPPELTGGRDSRVLMPPARVLIIEPDHGSYMLYRYAADGEYGEGLGEWRPIPPDRADAVEYALEPTFRTDAWCTFWIFSKTGKQAHFHG